LEGRRTAAVLLSPIVRGFGLTGSTKRWFRFAPLSGASLKSFREKTGVLPLYDTRSFLL